MQKIYSLLFVFSILIVSVSSLAENDIKSQQTDRGDLLFALRQKIDFNDPLFGFAAGLSTTVFLHANIPLYTSFRAIRRIKFSIGATLAGYYLTGTSLVLREMISTGSFYPILPDGPLLGALLGSVIGGMLSRSLILTVMGNHR